MKKLFISQPMRGISFEEIEETRERARIIANEELNEKVEVINSYYDNIDRINKPLYYLGEAFKALSDADVAFFAKGWEKYRGCRLEQRACLDYDIPQIYE